MPLACRSATVDATKYARLPRPPLSAKRAAAKDRGKGPILWNHVVVDMDATGR